jgi:cation diffusion facilitator family transporter
MDKIFRTLLVSIIVNSILSIFKITFGFIGYSKALIADGIHSFSDIIVDIIGIASNKIANKPPDDEHPYGHGKMEYIAGILISVVIFWLGSALFIDAFKSEHFIPDNIIVFIVALTIILKFLLAKYVIKKGIEYKNNILIANGIESKMDVLSSFVVLLSFLFSKLYHYHGVFKYSDKIGAIIIAILILRVAITILKDNITCLLDEKVDDKNLINKVYRTIKKTKQVKQITSINIIKCGYYYRAAIRLSIDGDISLKEAHDLVHQIEDRLINKIEKIRYVSIHINPYEEEVK